MNAAGRAVRPGRRANSTPARDHGVGEVADDAVPHQAADYQGRPGQHGVSDGDGAVWRQQAPVNGQPDSRDGRAPQDDSGQHDDDGAQ